MALAGTESHRPFPFLLRLVGIGLKLQQIGLRGLQRGLGLMDLGLVHGVVDQGQHGAFMDDRTIIDRLFGVAGSGPSDLMIPTTWAPTSMTSSGSTVPVELMVLVKLSRLIAAVRKLTTASAARRFV